MNVLPENMNDCIQVAPARLIYCWKCEDVEVMKAGRASAEFVLRHKDHQQETLKIELRYGNQVRAA